MSSTSRNVDCKEGDRSIPTTRTFNTRSQLGGVVEPDVCGNELSPSPPTKTHLRREACTIGVDEGNKTHERQKDTKRRWEVKVKVEVEDDSSTCGTNVELNTAGMEDHIDHNMEARSCCEGGLSSWTKKGVKMMWYIVIAAFTIACVLFLAGVVVGVLNYARKSQDYTIGSRSDRLLSASAVLLFLGALLLALNAVRQRKKCGRGAPEQDQELTETSVADHDELSTVNTSSNI